jgi:molecular chaperone Hsp33
VSDQDAVRRFVLQGGAVRGQWVQLASSWEALREHVDYPEPVRDLLGEAVVAAVLLASTLKFEGTLTLQLQGDGAVRLLVVQCSNQFELRALARFNADAVQADFGVLTGSGQLTVTVETAAKASARYQGIVPLVGDSLAEALEHYCQQSEQLPTVLRLSADSHVATGVLLQRIPTSGGIAVAADDASPESSDLWEQASAALRDISSADLLAGDGESLARRCGAGEDVRMFAPQAVQFRCRCSHERIADVLRSLGADELKSLIAEQGAVTVTCEFCQKPWRFDAIDVAELLQTATPQPPPSQRVN